MKMRTFLLPPTTYYGNLPTHRYRDRLLHVLLNVMGAQYVCLAATFPTEIPDSVLLIRPYIRRQPSILNKIWKSVNVNFWASNSEM